MLAVGAAINVKVAATFSTPMDPSTISAATFTVQQGSALVPGTVTYSGSTATFTPASNLATSTNFTATVSTGFARRSRSLCSRRPGVPFGATDFRASHCLSRFSQTIRR